MACVQLEHPISIWRKAAVKALGVEMFNHNIRNVCELIKVNSKSLPFSGGEKKRPLSWKAMLSIGIFVFFCA